MAHATRRRQLGEILVSHGSVSPGQLDEALEAQARAPGRERLGATIIRLGFCTEDDVADALAAQLDLLRVDLGELQPDPAAVRRVPQRLAQRTKIVPLRVEEDDVLVVAMSDPTNVFALDDLKTTTGLKGVRPLVTTQSQVQDVLANAYGGGAAHDEVVRAVADSSADRGGEDAIDDLVSDGDTGEQPIIRLANAILSEAARSRASDVHVEPERDSVRIRYRIDGMLREATRVPRAVGPALVSRLKIISELDIAERRRPQDGRAVVRVDGSEVDLRVSTMPTLFGESVVLRLLRKGAQRLLIDDIGMAREDQERFEYALTRPQGLIVITGPTGSGKTTTLYGGLAELVDPVRNIITLEDPIEYQLEGVNQTQVNPRIDLTFARGLRTVLRQDPDVVMVGEIRDHETAELAMEASYTGHLVLSTLHTNDAPSTIVRLANLGIERFVIASSLLMVVAQRLLRVICPSCRVKRVPEPLVLQRLGLDQDDLAGADLAAGAGCAACNGTGYAGRLGVYEVLAVDARLREAIVDGGSEMNLARVAHDGGMQSLRADGIRKALAGITTLDEVLRATPEPSVVLPGHGAAADDRHGLRAVAGRG